MILPRRRQIGSKIRSARRAAHLSQIQLGDLIGRDNKSISR
ncbi:hypothetical protein [Streptomyces sp. SID4982]|nr:hypothetical protein [Streptomyces sp. SID4982]